MSLHTFKMHIDLQSQSHLLHHVIVHEERKQCDQIRESHIRLQHSLVIEDPEQMALPLSQALLT